MKSAFFLLALVFVLYGNTIFNKYSMDDEFVTVNNPAIQKGLKALPEVFTSHYVETDQQSYDYRPVVKTTFALEFAIFKLNPYISHLVNVLLYFVLCLILYGILKLLLRNYHPWLPMMICVLFAAHPLHAEVVASLKNRDELLSMLFSLAAWYYMIKYVDTRKMVMLAIALLSFLLAFYSKPNAIVYAAVIPLSLYFFREIRLKKILLLTALLLISGLVLNSLPDLFLSPTRRGVLYFENPLFYEKGLWLRLGTALVVILFYLRLLIFPHPLLFYYGYNTIPIVTPLNIWAIISLLICLALLATAIYLFRRKHQISFAILIFFITISVFSNIIVPMPGIAAERFTFSASLGFIIIVCCLLFLVFKIDLFQKNTFSLNTIKYPLIIFLLILIPYSIRTIVRNADWKDFNSLYSHDIEYLGKSAKANTIYAAFLYSEMSRTKDPIKYMSLAENAQKYYENALSIYPEYAVAWNNLGILYFKYQQKPSEAVHCFKKAFACDTTYAEALLNTAGAFDELKINDSAEYYYLKSVSIKKKFTIAYSKLCDFYYRQGKVDKAIETNKKIMETDSSSDVPYINIGNYYLLGKDTVKAIEMWEIAIKKYPNNPDLCTNLSKYFEHIGNLEKAAYYNKLALKRY